MKSNLYSISIFLIGLFITYVVTKNVQQHELQHHKDEISTQSQAISHTLQHKLMYQANQLSTIAQRWQSIEQINSNWHTDIKHLKYLLPHIDDISLCLLKPQTALSIEQAAIRYLNNDKTMLQKSKHLRVLNKQLKHQQSEKTFLSVHKITANNQTTIYFQAPIFIDKILIGYLDASLNLTQLLDEEVENYQIISPFSLSESGRTIYSVLPKAVQINNIYKQFSIPILDKKWKLMVWPLQQHNFYQYIPSIGIMISMLLSLVAFFAHRNKILQQKLRKQESNLSTMSKDFSASKSKLIQSNKLSSLGEIATGIAHEINQPLQVICIHADLCQDSLQKQHYDLVEKSFRSIISQVERIEKIVKQVGSFARDSEQDNYHKALPATIFENVIDIVINQYNQEDVELRQILPPSLPLILCNKIQIEQVLVNLLINAKDAVEESEEKVVFIKAHDRDEKLYIEVSDSGTGIEPNKLDDIFTPFYTTKALGKGTGLGLSISYSIIHQHKGELYVSSEIGKGSTFTVILPLEKL